MSIETREITVSLGQLLLDPNNYRLNNGEEIVKYSLEELVSKQEGTRKLLSKKNTSDLERSILENGFLEVDKIVVKKIESNNDSERYLVIEGNRRTAAFKSLIINNYDEGNGAFLESFPEVLREKYKSINVVLVLGDEEEVEKYSRRLMGIRHVSGPKQWGGYQSAKLINDMCLSEENYETISDLLGLSVSEVKRRRNAYRAFNQMRSFDSFKEKANTNLFSLFVEVAGAREYFRSTWLGWNEEELEFNNSVNLKRFYEAITPNENGELEIKNPTNLRFFIKSIEIVEVRTQIESGVPISDVNYNFDEHKRINKINGFIDFVTNFDSFTTNDLDRLRILNEFLSSMFLEDDA
jgi:hypothetical protein